ncbi:MAG: hypothetical protein WCV99_19240 [Sterolibacterium sp.]|jgi:hypothetical protein
MNTPTLIPRLDRHFFTRLKVSANPDFKPPDKQQIVDDAVVESSMVVHLNKGGKEFSCTLTVKLLTQGKLSSPYDFDIECVGFFVDESGIADDTEPPLSVQIAHQVLYSAAREMLMTTTSRMAWGSFTLPITLLQRNAKPPSAVTTSEKTVTRRMRIRKKTAA